MSPNLKQNGSAKRKICFVITSKIHYARSKLILSELKKNKGIDLQIVAAGAAILERYGDVEKIITADGFSISARITMVLEGGTTVAMAKSTGVGMMEFATVFENLNPDIVVVRGDRYEVIAPAAAAAYMNKAIAHIEGGDVTGSIDESVRHAITKLSHIHFATNHDSKKRIMRMGENPRYVFDVGAPDAEFAARNRHVITNHDVLLHGVGASIDIKKPFVIVMQHPVTTEFGKNQAHMEAILQAIGRLKMQTILFWPNIDAGADEVSRAIRIAREDTDLNNYTRFIRYLEPHVFIALLSRATCLIGNSSSGIKECSYLGVPVVNIGTRQAGRMKAKNVIDTPPQAGKILKAIRKQIGHGAYARSTLYYKKDSSKKIAKTLQTISLYTQKRFVD